MLIVLSPAKSLDFDTPPVTPVHTQPAYLKRAKELVQVLRAYSPAELAALMDLSDPLAQLNAIRFSEWTPKFTPTNAKQAVLAFNGDVYDGLKAPSMTERQLTYLQEHVRILSGLYGILRPLDLMQAYRLEMGTRLTNPRGADLYAYWGDSLAEALNAELATQASDTLVNLASEEYFRAVKAKRITGRVVTPVFEDWKNGKYKVISFFAKRARGSMARYAAQKRITKVEKLKAFDLDGYAYAAADSSDDQWIFRRKLVE